MAKVTIITVACKRCGKPIATASRSILGLDSLKAQYGSICHDCMSDDERNQMLLKMCKALVSHE